MLFVILMTAAAAARDAAEAFVSHKTAAAAIKQAKRRSHCKERMLLLAVSP